jgi:adenine-specific DNA-methyltransferase
MRTNTFFHGDCLEGMKELPDSSVDLIVADPPYMDVKMDQEWDRQWKTRDDYLVWIGELCKTWMRVLKPNGSLYVFASPQMAAHVEVTIGKVLNVLNRIRWLKEAGWHRKAVKEELRSYLSPWEEIVFAEHPAASIDYETGCDGIVASVFESIRQYLSKERDRAGWTTRRVAEEFQKKTGSRTVTGMAGHWFEKVQWTLPTEENYQWLRQLFNKEGDYEYLRRDYEDLRRDYEYLRRPFSVSSDIPYTDVWDFPTVQAYNDKHVCEKPKELLKHIVTVSSRDGATVLDPFMGSGALGVVCKQTGRNYIGMETDASYFKRAKRRVESVKGTPGSFELGVIAMSKRLSEAQLANMSLLDASKWLVDDPAWTAENALSMLHELVEHRALLKNLDPTSLEKPPSLCWQQQSQNLWVFGEMVRGVVRQEKGRVFSELRRWYAKVVGGEQCAFDSLGEGVSAVETILGVK